MAQLIVRNLDDDVKAKLQERARRHRRSTEEEVREILRNAVKEEGGSQPGLGTRIAARFAAIGGMPKLEAPPRQPPRAPDFSE